VVFSLQLALAAAVLSALWAALRPRPAFVVRVEQGVPRVTKGTVTRAFRQQIAETCGRHGVRKGVIRGVANQGRITLAFSTGIPTACRQQLRNIWALSGWSAQS